ncbi:Uncharacterised protein [Streptococcus pneumoniae]|uniref:Cardiolipin synthase N-terminal domain-containing protein n=1 Tax=Streptococcus pneumoniae TaxID=1313 RepID=A0AA87C760_STREE|nr:Uncharacterised protein [Streptococcus pneumoniae]CIS74390.1 Uncharacterised protein [Streptococcus pneumoniae]CIY95032.1 Uncharacterised protein [Streptococcus pneumoniae]CJV54385.1 Uncharacterised protein [Streptococcus pneumoniae]CJW99531.1 Uncharacterised protein [Streptococcus pneumoniae]
MNKILLIIIPMVILYILYLIFFFLDIKNNEVRYFSKIIWFIICLISVPLGGITYFLIGRKEEYDHDEEIDRTI